MKKIIVLNFCLFIFAFQSIEAQSILTLKQKIGQVLEGNAATVGVAIQGVDPTDTISINGHLQLPMQSVFKYHLALTTLHYVDQGKCKLEDSIVIDKERIQAYSHLWSPLRKKYPDGAKVPLAEILKYTVALSDNLGCDLLFELIGGVNVVQAYMNKIGVRDIAIVHTEIEMQSKWEYQYENWITAKAANQTLQLFFENKDNLLSPESHQFLLNILKETKTGKKSIRGLLPKETVVAHKTGHSGKNSEGLTGAQNDIGIIIFSESSYFYVSILLSDSMEDKVTNQRIIAEIAKLTWDYFLKKDSKSTNN